MKSLSKNIYAILVFNTLLIGFLSSVFVNKSHALYPWHSVGMFTFNALLVVAIVISSYHVGKSLFDTKSNQILSFGFFITSTGFILLSVSIVGYFAIIREFNTPSFLINFLVFATAFLIVPLLVAKPNKALAKLLKSNDSSFKQRSATINKVEKLRESFKPNNVKVLFVGQSAPESGAFFYDGNPHSFTTNIRKTFEIALEIEFEDNNEFLNYFKSKECYLDDLCSEPVNHLPTTEVNAIQQDSIVPLSKRIQEANPEVVITLMSSIQNYVHSAVELSGVSSKVIVAPFPGMGHLPRFRGIVVPIIKKYIKK